MTSREERCRELQQLDGSEVAKHLNSGPIVYSQWESHILLSITELGRRYTRAAQAMPNPLGLGSYGLLGPLAPPGIEPPSFPYSNKIYPPPPVQWHASVLFEAL